MQRYLNFNLYADFFLYYHLHFNILQIIRNTISTIKNVLISKQFRILSFLTICIINILLCIYKLRQLLKLIIEPVFVNIITYLLFIIKPQLELLLAISYRRRRYKFYKYA